MESPDLRVQCTHTHTHRLHVLSALRKLKFDLPRQCTGWRWKSNCSLLLQTPGKRVVSCDWLSPESSEGQGLRIYGRRCLTTLTPVSRLADNSGQHGANVQEAESIGRQNNCFTCWHKDINLSFEYIGASLTSLPGRQRRPEQSNGIERGRTRGPAHRTPARLVREL